VGGAEEGSAAAPGATRDRALGCSAEEWQALQADRAGQDAFRRARLSAEEAVHNLEGVERVSHCVRLKAVSSGEKKVRSSPFAGGPGW
jgi:hypothetical protein